MPAEPRPFGVGERPVIRGEAAGEGPPVVLCHGITATRRYVVHGSRALERAGHTVVSYDARGHGESDPAPGGQGYGYPELVGDLEAVVDATVGEGRSCSPVTRWERIPPSPTRCGTPSASAASSSSARRTRARSRPRRSPTGTVSPRRWRSGGVDGFVEYIDRHQETDPAWRDSVLRFTRERMLQHRHPEALVDALREVPRSRPFGAMTELESLRLPALVVASHDAADPGHPRHVAEAYAERLPQARLTGEAEGESPLAWQGGRLSREIAAFCAEVGQRVRMSGMPESQGMPDEGHAIHYSAVTPGTPVYSSDGVEVGRVAAVLDNRKEHIFDGVVFEDEAASCVSPTRRRSPARPSGR